MIPSPTQAFREARDFLLAQRGRHDAVALMLALGWPVAVKGDWDASALNQEIGRASCRERV